MDMPVVATARFERDVKYTDLLRRYRCEIALTDKIFAVRVRFADREHELPLKRLFCRRGFLLWRPDVFCQIENGPCFRPSRVKRHMRYGSGDFFARHAVCFRIFEMIAQRRIRNPLRHERDDRQQTALLDADSREIPVLAEQYIIIKMRERRREFAERFASCRLDNLFFRHVNHLSSCRSPRGSDLPECDGIVTLMLLISSYYALTRMSNASY